MVDSSDAYEIVRSSGVLSAPVVYTCEHASNALPPDWSWGESDRWITGTHWAWDIGAANITRHLVKRSGAVGVLAKFSRLLIDANRDQSSDMLFRTEAEGRSLDLNKSISDREKRTRIENFYVPYHEAVDRCIQENPGVPVIAIHSFTPVYEGHEREMEVGVLFDHSDDLAHAIALALKASGFQVAMNEPYSGKNGMMYSAYRHAHQHGRQALEFEIRQDLLETETACVETAERILNALSKVGLGGA